MGEDGHRLLAALGAPAAPEWLRHLPAVDMLRRGWIQQFYLADGQVRWRTEQDGIPPAARFISSPYDADAHYACKGSTSWIGYKVHLSETCEEGLPRIITAVQTTAGPVVDGDVTTPIHTALQNQGLLPAQHILDTGYLSAGLLVQTQRDFGIDLVGPVRVDCRWQSQAGKGFAMDAFTIDWEAQRVTCPRNVLSSGWTPATDNRGTPVIKVKFSAKDCQACLHRADCAGPTAKRRVMTFRTQDEYIALQAARRRQKTPAFASLYAMRAGIEATISQGVRAFDLRRSRYFGQAKTHLQHVATAAAMNLVRLVHWVSGDSLARTRQSHFAQLIRAHAAR
jgi:transposase